MNKAPIQSGPKMNRKWQESRQQWEVELWERQYDLAPADIARTSQYRACVLSRNAPLPMSISATRLWAGAASVVLGVIGGAIFQTSPVLRFGCLFGGIWVGLYLTLASVRWIEK